MVDNQNLSLEERFKPIRQKMKSAGLRKEQIEIFKAYYNLLLNGVKGEISGDQIEPVDRIKKSDELDDYDKFGIEALSSTVVIKLNGGLGTSMGLDRAKSLLTVKNHYSFLDIILNQIKKIRQKFEKMIPLVFMNSEKTGKDTESVIKSHQWHNDGIPFGFLQSKVPKIRRDTFEPVKYPNDPALEWCPPGHGDIYNALKFSGLLDALLKKGYRFAFISNSDNLGATLDERILGYFAHEKFPFMMEVAVRTQNDRKGGHLARWRKGGWLLREIAQCPQNELNDFQNISVFKYFNTNTIWLNLEAVREMLERSDNKFMLPLIVNRKTVDPKDLASTPIYQLETAMGAAIGLFPGASVIEVPRSRFLPVKTCQDLVALWSDAYRLTDDFHLILDPSREVPVLTHLDQKYFRMIHQLKERFPFGPPSLISCREWSVSGNVIFGRNVRLEGRVVIENRTNEVFKISDNTQLKDETIII